MNMMLLLTNLKMVIVLMLNWLIRELLDHQQMRINIQAYIKYGTIYLIKVQLLKYQN